MASFWDALKPWLGLPVEVKAQSVNYSELQGPSFLSDALRGVGSSEQAALSISAVYRSVSLISGAVGSMPLRVKRRAGRVRDEAPDHWAWPLLTRKPNGWQTPQQFKKLLAAHLLLRGNAYAMKVGTPARVSALIPLRPDRMMVKQRDDWSLEYHYTRKNGELVLLSQSDVMHIVGLSLDGFTGLSVLGCAAATIGQALMLQRHGTSVFENSTRIGGVLSHPNKLGDEAVARLRASLEAFRGPSNSGKSLILEEGMTFEKMAMTLEDAQFVQNAGLSRTEIYQFFGLPPHMAGDTEKASSWGTGIEAMSLGFVTYTLNDWLVAFEEAINRDLLAADTSLYARFNRDALVRGDIKTRYGAYAVARQWGLKSPNEIRALEDMNPYEGGDDFFIGGNGQRSEAEPAQEANDA